MFFLAKTDLRQAPSGWKSERERFGKGGGPARSTGESCLLRQDEGTRAWRNGHAKQPQVSKNMDGESGGIGTKKAAGWGVQVGNIFAVKHGGQP